MALLRLLALDLDSRVQASEGLVAEQVHLDLAESRRIALENLPEYLAQIIASDAADIGFDVAKNQRLWDISLVLGANYAHTDIANPSGESRPRSWDRYGGVQVSIPLGDLTRRQNQLRAAVNVEDQKLQLDDARQALEQRVSDAVRDVGTRWRQFEIAERARELSVRKLDIEREKLQVGRSSNFQVLSFEGDLRAAQSARLEALIGYPQCAEPARLAARHDTRELADRAQCDVSRNTSKRTSRRAITGRGGGGGD